jgi:chromosome segregation ATPase
MLLSEKSNLLREKQNLEMEIARLQGRRPAIDEQIMRIKKEIDQKIQDDQVSEELRKILALQVQYLEEIKKLTDVGRASNNEVADAEEKLARARIELARRREQIGASAGTDQLAKFSNELAMQAIDMAEKKAMLEIVSNQLDRTEQQLTAGDISDPQISRIRMAMQALEVAERRVNELNARLVNLQLPTVSVLGGE